MEKNQQAFKNSKKNMKKITKEIESNDQILIQDEIDLKLNSSKKNSSKSENFNNAKVKKPTKNILVETISENKPTPNFTSNPLDIEEKDNVNIKDLVEENEQESETQQAQEKRDENSSSDESKSDDEETPTPDDLTKDKYFSNIKFDEFEIHPLTLQSLNELGFKTATEIQGKTIPLSLSGADIMGAAKTGSGKSLAFLIPAVETLIKLKHLQGTKALILTPTRELALQLYNLAKDLLMYHKETCALIIGGANRKVEAEKLKSGASMIIATPGRLLDHLKNTKGFIWQNISMLIIDEADAILKIGFEHELKEIIGQLPKKRQTLLFSATMNNKLDDIIRLSLKNPIQISTKSHVATVTNLEQGYVVIEPDKKFLLLYTFLRKNPNKKIIVFFSSCKAVEFYTHLLNYVDISVKSTHGGQKQQKRTATFFEFSNMDKGILLCTDVVQRGLDFPDVDWIIQYDPPHNPEEYIHRVGRTARGAEGKGKALLILLKYEIGLVRYLKASRVDIKEFEFPESRLLKVQDQFEKLAYIAHTLKDVYDINNLDLSKLCKSFGLVHPPMVNLNVRIQSSSQRKKNGYGNKEKDPRQFVY